MRLVKKSISVLVFVIYVFLLENNIVFALGSREVGGFTVHIDWFEDVFIWIIGLAGVVAAAVLIFSAYLYITAGGDEQKIYKATKGITYAIIGLIVAAVAFLIVNFVIEGVSGV